MNDGILDTYIAYNSHYTYTEIFEKGTRTRNTCVRTLKYLQCMTCVFCFDLSTLKWPRTSHEVSGSMVATNIEIFLEVSLVALVEMFTANVDMMIMFQ